MPKPACVRCQRFLRPYRNGVRVLEGYPIEDGATKPGLSAPDLWLPYKLWQAELYRCEGCGIEIIAGWAKRPYMMDKPQQMREAATYRVNDC